MSREGCQLAAQCDGCLRPFIEADSASEREESLEVILDANVQPIIRRVIARRNSAISVLGAGAEEDIASTVVLRLLRRLQAMLVFEEEAIARLDDYVATLTYNTIYDFMRRRYPQRTRLRNRLLYVLQHDSRFLVRTVDDEILCGLRSWGENRPHMDDAVLSELAVPAGAFDRERPGDALEAILSAVGTPVAFETLQRSVADLWNVTDRQSPDALPLLPDSRRSQHEELETRDALEAVWREVVTLPEAQRTAMLLNLRDPDGHNAAAHLVLLGIVSFDELARVAGLTPERLEGLWNDLPLGDTEIAAILGLSRQQVINLRQAGRRRLARRLRGLSKEPAGHN
jgi:DNA-directed RNA polymerase specialized sigma24 family protein